MVQQWICPFLIMTGLLIGCTHKDEAYFIRQAERIKRELSSELESIQTLGDLFIRQEGLTIRFEELAQLAIDSRQFQVKTKRCWELSDSERESGKTLTRELQRVLTIAGAQAVIEKCQLRAVEKIDSFEKRSGSY